MQSMLERNIALPLDAIRAFCERNHIRRLALFGSVLREDFRAGQRWPQLNRCPEFFRCSLRF